MTPKFTAEYLAEQKRLAEAATEGPWEVDQTEPGIWCPKRIVIGNYTAADMFESPAWEDGTPEDLAFIAAARESVPRLVAALEAVMAVHRRSHAVFSWEAGGIRYEDPCPECGEKAGVHPCGCWADVDIEYVCSECKVGTKGSSVPWPCPTICAVEAALGDEGDGAAGE